MNSTRRLLYEEPMENISVRVTVDQRKRYLDTNDAAERIRHFIDSWDMDESPEQLEIEAMDHEKMAREELAAAEEKRARARVLREGSCGEFDHIKEVYDEYNIGKYDRDRQIKWLEGKWGMSIKKAHEFLGQYGPGTEEEC